MDFPSSPSLTDAWAKSPEYPNWLKDPKMLPHVAPDARISAFAYQSPDSWDDLNVENSVSHIANELVNAIYRNQSDVCNRVLGDLSFY